MFNEPKESDEFPGFFEIPGYPGFVISKEGLIINCYQHRFVPRLKTTTGYTAVNLGLGRKNSRFIAVHLLVARTFLPRPKGHENDDLEVNHIDGNKTNPRLSNLEWVTPQENVWHAGRTGLTESCIPIQTLNNITGEEKEYPSVRECAKDLGMNERNVNYMRKFGADGRRIFAGGFRIRKKTTEPWPTDTFEQELSGAIPVDIRNLITGEEFTVNSLIEAAKLVNMETVTISKRLCANVQCVYENGLQMKSVSVPQWRTPGDLILEVGRTYNIKPVQMYYPLTGKSRVFACKKSCERITGISANRLINLLRTKIDKIRRYDSEGEPVAYGYYPIYSDMSLPLEIMEW